MCASALQARLGSALAQGRLLRRALYMRWQHAAGALGRCLHGTRRQRALKFGALSSISAQFLKGCFLKALGESFGRAPGTVIKRDDGSAPHARSARAPERRAPGRALSGRRWQLALVKGVPVQSYTCDPPKLFEGFCWREGCHLQLDFGRAL